MVNIPQRVLGEALERSSERFPSKTAIIIKSREYEYSALYRNAVRLAAHLVRSGTKKGDRIAVYMSNSWECIIAIYAISLSGAAFMVINPQTRSDKLEYILNDSGARILISESFLGSELSEALKGSSNVNEIIVTGKGEKLSLSPEIKLTLFEDAIDAKNSDTPLPRVIPNDLAALIYTSGSTGFPKGVMMTHQSMVFAAWSLIEYLRLTEEDRLILLLPLAFDYGLYQLIMSVTIGGSIIVEQSFTFQASVYRQMEAYRPTVFPGVPTIYAMMIAGNKKTGISFDFIEKITNTAAALPDEFLPDLRKIFPGALIFKMYGLTECKRVCYLEPELIDAKPGSVGKAIPGTEVFLLSPEGKPVPPGEKGILHIRGPHVMLGYWHKEELSREMLRSGPLPGERILCSNDWFRMDEEGFLYFLGRNDDIIKSRGEKVSPAEVENVLHRIEGIREASVLGVPDEIMGEAIIAFVTTDDPSKRNEKEILRECMSKLELFMVPQHVVFLDEMPKSSNSKIDKKILKKMYLNNDQG